MDKDLKEQVDKAKNIRRAAKGKLTRILKTVNALLGAERPVQEIKDVLKEAKDAYNALVAKHEEYTMFLNDEEYDDAESWLNECCGEFTQMSIVANDYIKSTASQNNVDKELNAASIESITNNEPVVELSSDTLPPNETDKSDKSTEADSNDQESVPPVPIPSKPFYVKHEKPKLPTFYGDVRKYFIFKSDFQHSVELHCSERDAITVLRSCLGPEPAKLVEGITSDLKAAWKYLDRNYGDPRVISDTITADLEKFRALQPGDDHRFCELVNLVRKSFNILKEVKRPQDMDNTHIISLIERKMTSDDLKVWSRHIYVQEMDPSLENLLKWMDEEMTVRLRSGATIRKGSGSYRSNVHAVGTGSNYQSPRYNNDNLNKPSTAESQRNQCYACKEIHYVDQCPRFKAMTPNERWKVVKEQKACFSCLKRSKNHTASNCMRKKECLERNSDGSTCKKYHHKLLHETTTSPNVVGFVQDNSEAVLPVISAMVKGPNGECANASVFYDSGAQVSMIRDDFAEELGLESKPVTILIAKVGETEEELNTKLYKVPVYTSNGKTFQTIEAVGIPQISHDTTTINADQVSKVFDIPKNEFRRKPGPIDILVGINYPAFHVGETKVKKGLAARKSPLGWVVFGVKSQSSTPKAKQVLNIRFAPPVDISEFWKTDSMGVSVSPCTCEAAKMSPEERAEMKIIEESCNLEGNKWTMNYPWKKDPKQLPNNYTQVVKKMETTERRLRSKPDYAESYNSQITEMEEMRFSRKLTKKEIEEWDGPVHYISHHAVIRPEKKSTPLRIVFNSSATFEGHCLNDYWYKGPDLLNNLFGVVLRFRENPIAISGDISKMYHMVSIPPTDQHVHRFVWRNCETEREPDIFVKTVLTFGDRPAPAMATTAMRKTASLKEDVKPRAAEAIVKNAYVDDICDSVCTVEEAKDLTSDINEVLESGGFHIKKWVSNAPIDSDETSAEQKLVGNKDDAEKVLGTVWSPSDDKFSFKIKTESSANVTTNQSQYLPSKLTKRQILSKIAAIFDPIGVGAAIVIKAKIALQELWQLGLNWDDEVSTALRKKWICIFEEISRLNDVKFDRCLTPPEVFGKPSLVVLCDASRLAFGAVAYIRWKLKNGKFGVRFVAAKSRVAPLKELTIPRLELQAAVIGSRLGKTVQEESRFEFEKVRYLTDSRVTLAWIQGQTRTYKPFVSSRVAEIQSNTEPTDWSHCPTDVNVADDVTKGIPVEEINVRWLPGPTFLQLPEEQWPTQRGTPDMKEVNRERRKVTITCATTVLKPVLDCTKFSSWKRLLRVTAYVQRFCHNVRAKLPRQKDVNTHEGPLNSCEMRSAEEYWLKVAQTDLVKRMKNGDFKTLTPFFDANGVIRVGGRVDPRLVSYENARPALLPRKHWISVLVTRNAHQTSHSGVDTTTAKTRRKYWVIRGQDVAKVEKSRCTFCRKMKAEVEEQFMANLPASRLQPCTPPFMFTSCDYFGPINVKVGRNKTTKHYGVIFTCMNTRAVHCEIAVDASAMEFLQVLRRFFSYRGYPKLMLSDNGLQMVGAENELRKMIDGLDKKMLKEYCADRGITWQFTTPLAPHQNGCSESMVKSCKSAIKKAIGDTLLTPFELYTCILEAANLINQRPIGKLSQDPDDGAYLCPNDILLGRATNAVPQGPFRETKNPRHRFEFCQKIIDSFWKKWSAEVLPFLVPRKKWNRKNRNVRVDDYVVVAEANAVRGKWQTGRVVQVFPGDDGLVRNVEVKTATGLYRRPITKISVVYPVEGFED